MFKISNAYYVYNTLVIVSITLIEKKLLKSVEIAYVAPKYLKRDIFV